MKQLIYFLMILFLFGCASNNEQPKPQVFSQKSLKLIEETSEFNWNLFRTMNADSPEKNFVISPLSITQAFGMAISGATGENQDEMLNVFGLNNIESMNDAHKGIREVLSAVDSKTTINIANSAWYNSNYGIKTPYKESLRNYYDAEILGLDFNNGKQAVETINSWVNEKTQGKISNIVDVVYPSHVLFLINAVYFYGSWTYQFDESATSDAQFYLSSGDNVSIKMMNQENDLEYFDNDNYRGVKIPYGNGTFLMTVILPQNDNTTDKLIESLDAKEWNNINKEHPIRKVGLLMPRFKTECDFKLIPPLSKLGMNMAFDPMYGLGFKNISDLDIFISEVKHKTFIEVDEKGTEAAAVTGIGVGITSEPDPNSRILFEINKPFLFFISEKQSGAVLFAGKIENPLQEK